MKCFAFLGIQGCGKGTQAQKLSAWLEYQHINIGDLFRYHIKNQTALGTQVSQIIQRGELVPDSLVFELVAASTDKGAKGIVFDGFPRTLPQAEYLLKHYELKQVFYLDLSEQVALDRISARRVCPVCGANYNLISQPPVTEGVCDVDGAELIIRNDDKPEAIRKRFAEFYEQTEPLRDFFSNHGLLTTISAHHSIAHIFETITQVVDATDAQ